MEQILRAQDPTVACFQAQSQAQAQKDKNENKHKNKDKDKGKGKYINHVRHKWFRVANFPKLS